MTPAQQRLLKELEKINGPASPYDLNYPRTPLLRRLRDAGFIALGAAPIYDEFNCDISITEAGRKALAARG